MLAWTIYLLLYWRNRSYTRAGEKSGRWPPHRSAHGAGGVGDCDHGYTAKINGAN